MPEILKNMKNCKNSRICHERITEISLDFILIFTETMANKNPAFRKA